MKLKEKLNQCYQILFKGRDFVKELQDAEEDYQVKLREPQELAEKLKEQLELQKERLEFLINSATPALMTEPDSVMNAEKVPIYEVKIVPYSSPHRPEYSETAEVHFMDLQRVEESYRFMENPNEVSDRLNYYYERAAHLFAKLLIQKKLLRVRTYRHAEDINLFTMKFETLFYKGK